MGLLLLLPQQAIVRAGEKTAPDKEAYGLFCGDIRAPHISHNPEWVETGELKKNRITTKTIF